MLLFVIRCSLFVVVVVAVVLQGSWKRHLNRVGAFFISRQGFIGSCMVSLSPWPLRLLFLLAVAAVGVAVGVAVAVVVLLLVFS